MAFVYRNALMPAVAKWNSYSAIFHKFDKAWGSSMHEGVAVYDGWLPYYTAKTWIETEELQRFLKAIGINWNEFRNQEINSEINDLRFFLKDDYVWDGSVAGDNKYDFVGTEDSTQLVAPTAQEIVDVFNSTFAIGEEITVTVQYGGPTRRYLEEHNLDIHINESGIITTDGLNTDEIRAVLEGNPWYYLANSRHLPYEPNSHQFQLYTPDITTSFVLADYGLVSEDIVYALDREVEPILSSPTSRLLGTTITSCEAEENIPQDENENLGVFAFMDNAVFTRIEDVSEEPEGYEDGYEVVDGSIGTINFGNAEEIVMEDVAAEDFAGTPPEDYEGGVIPGEVLTYTYSQKFKYNGMSVSSKLVQEIVLWYESSEILSLDHHIISYKTVDEYRNELTFHTLDTSYKKALDTLVRYVDVENGGTTGRVTNSLFYDGYLRYEPARQMRRKHFVEMLASSIDIDEQIEKASSWERATAYIIVIIAVIVAVFSYGTLATQSAGIAWSAIATSAGYATLTLAIGMYGLSYFGGLSAQGLVKSIGAFAQIVGVIAAVAGLMAAVQAAGKALAQKTLNLTAAELASDAGVNAVREEMLKQTLTDQVSALLDQTYDSITSKLGQFVNLDLKQQVSFIQDGLKFVSDGLKYYEDKEANKLQDELNVLEAEAEEAEAENLSNQLKNPAAVYVMMEDSITSYDAISNIDNKIQATVGKDKSFAMWDSNVNSV